MQIYKISPIVKYSPFFTLTYVSKHDFEIGNIVQIDFNRKEIYGLVVEKYNLADAKVEIRKADFQTKKINIRLEEKIENFLSDSLFKMLLTFSESFLIPVGELFFYIWGEDFSGNSFEIKDNLDQKLIFLPDDLSYKISKKVSEKEKYVKGAEIFQRLLERNFETLVVADFNFDRYLNFQSPHISKLDLLLRLLKPDLVRKGVLVKRLVLESDFLGVVETSWLGENVFNGKLFGKIDVEVNEKRNKAKKFLVKSDKDEFGEQVVLAKEILDKLENSKTEEKNFLFVLSHGYADRVFCNDCRKSYDCEKCNHPFSILNEENGRFLYCKNCKNKKVLKDDQYVICKHCGSWRVFPFGVGGQKVLETLKDSGFTLGSIVFVDESEKKMSIKKMREKVESFLDKKSEENLLIGSIRTLKVLQNLKGGVDRSFVVSTGPIVRGQNFDSDERHMKLISEVENLSKEVYINKREGDEVSLENYRDKENFVIQEIPLRKKLGLPPATKVMTLIFNYKNKRFVDKFLSQDIEKFKPAGEMKKGNNFIYYWFIPSLGEGIGRVNYAALRQFGDLVVANSIIEQSVLGKK